MKKRLDVLLVEQGLAPSREKAKTLIMLGQVYANDQKADKVGNTYEETVKLEVRGQTLRYVSRGGLKLEKAMERFHLSLQNKVCMDVGASTGGFTDCMLQNGAKRVYAVDVGYGQLAWSLRNDERVVNYERTNFRYFTKDKLDDEVDFVSVDVSFISLTLILPVVKVLLSEHGECVCLIKPQFEAGREHVGKKGVVKDPAVHTQVIEKILHFAQETGFGLCHLDFSPIKGPEGNIEYLLHLMNNSSRMDVSGKQVKLVVEASHQLEPLGE